MNTSTELEFVYIDIVCANVARQGAGMVILYCAHIVTAGERGRYSRCTPPLVYIAKWANHCGRMRCMPATCRQMRSCRPNNLYNSVAQTPLCGLQAFSLSAPGDDIDNRSLISVTVNSSSSVRKRGTGKWLLGSFWRDVRMKCIPGHNPPLAFTHFPGIGPEPLNQLDSILPRSLS